MKKGVQALVVFPDGMFVAQTPLIIGLAARNRLPAMYGLREYAEVGGLMTYGTNLAEMHRQLRNAFHLSARLAFARPAAGECWRSRATRLVVGEGPTTRSAALH